MVWTSVPPTLWILVVAAAIIILPPFFYRLERPARRSSRALRPAWILRGLALTFLFLAWLGPHRPRTESVALRPRLAIAVDQSKSMGLAGAGSDRSRLARARDFLLARLPELRARREVDLYGFGEQSARIMDPGDLRADQALSRIHGAARRIARRGPQPYHAVLLLTDGRSVGDVDAPFVPDRGVPVYAIGVGVSDEVKDLSITTAAFEPDLLPGAPLVVRAEVRKIGYGALDAEVTLRAGDRVLVREPLRFAATETEKRVRLAYSPPEPGELSLDVEVEPRADEATRDNNRRPVRIRVARRGVEVLLVEGRPRWEYRHLKNALVRDPTVRLSALLLNADPDYLQEGSRGLVPLARMPSASMLEDRYDVILIGDVHPDHPRIRAAYRAPETLFRSLERYVTKIGGGLGLIAGPRHVRQWLGAPQLARLLPVRLETGAAGPRSWYDDTGYHPRLTSQGRLSPVLALLESPAANADLLEGRPFLVGKSGVRSPPLPPFQGHASGLVARPGATVLATLGPESAPLWITTQRGAGRVFVQATEETWLWRREHEDRYFYRFWRQVVHFLARDSWRRGGAASVRVNPGSCRPGDRVRLEAFALTDRNGSAADSRIPDRVEIVGPEGRRFPVALDLDASAPGRRTASWIVPAPGEYTVSWTGGKAKPVRFRAARPARELDRTDASATSLRSWVGADRYADLEEADALLERLPGEPRRIERFLGLESLWTGPWAVILFVALLTGEWLLRMRMRLL